VKIHAIQTGTVAVTEKWREGVGHGKRRLVNAIADRKWTEPLPIYAFAIEHPEGVIVVDTGEDARASERRYFARWHPGVRAFREWVEPQDEIGPQLERLGIQPGDVRWLVMTHLHTDHAGGLHHFPRNEILVTRAELESASGLRGRVRGYVANKHWPAWFRPTALELEPEPFGPFPESLRLTKAGDVTLVPLPGHTAGQIGVLVDDGEHAILIAGDASYTQELMLLGKPDGVGSDERAELLTHERIQAFAAENPTVYLVAHDPATRARLQERQVVHQMPAEGVDANFAALRR
jgi:N-acyl homoserine lactone hydrolase